MACIKDNYNNILESENWQEIINFMDKCETCPRFGSCDYNGYLDDRLRELDGELAYCNKCGERISISSGDVVFYDSNKKAYCEKHKS